MNTYEYEYKCFQADGFSSTRIIIMMMIIMYE